MVPVDIEGKCDCQKIASCRPRGNIIIILFSSGSQKIDFLSISSSAVNVDRKFLAWPADAPRSSAAGLTCRSSESRVAIKRAPLLQTARYLYRFRHSSNEQSPARPIVSKSGLTSCSTQLRLASSQRFQQEAAIKSSRHHGADPSISTF